MVVAVGRVGAIVQGGDERGPVRKVRLCYGKQGEDEDQHDDVL